MPIKAIGGDVDDILGAPNRRPSAIVAQAIRFAAEHGAKVHQPEPRRLRRPAPPSATRCSFAVDKGAVVVVSAGNDGEDGSPPLVPSRLREGHRRARSPSAAADYARSRAPYSNVNDYVEIAAPGGDVDDDLNGDGFADGVLQQTLDFDAVADGPFNEFRYFFSTARRCPRRTSPGLAALLVDQGITDPKAIEAALERFATDLGPPGRDNEYGYGLINPRATLRGLGLAR